MYDNINKLRYGKDFTPPFEKLSKTELSIEISKRIRAFKEETIDFWDFIRMNSKTIEAVYGNFLLSTPEQRKHQASARLLSPIKTAEQQEFIIQFCVLASFDSSMIEHFYRHVRVLKAREKGFEDLDDQIENCHQLAREILELLPLRDNLLAQVRELVNQFIEVELPFMDEVHKASILSIRNKLHSYSKSEIEDKLDKLISLMSTIIGITENAEI